MADRHEHGEGEHHQRDMAMPAVPASGLVVVEAQLGFRGLERVLDRPPPPLDLDQHVQGRARRAPCREEGHFPVAQAAPDQQTARPHQSRGATSEEASRIKVGQFQIGPVVKPRSLGPGAGGQPNPVGGRQGRRDLPGRAGHRLRLVPGVELRGACNAEHVSLARRNAISTSPTP